ncbi:IS91 family transposase [Oscillochloris sp. ZM17-4]|uniref:IS91 family transposase n=1 Tax=Oscillochloris sp. ZM17-4 TaxID=2866714 RepID=UPI001C737EB9|nr:IS91 family transposase [Oscillochloris sp. ZM17-4]
MTTLGEIFRRYGPAYRARYSSTLSERQLQAMQAIAQCRTEALGGHVYRCPACQTTRYSYHSCRNRHCPTCQQDASEAWLAAQQALLLPVPYFLVTFTVPAELRAAARQHPEAIYPLLFHAASAALQQLAHDPRFLGGQIGMLGVLQTWTRDLRYHPHVHFLVPALALSPGGKRWLIGKRDFLVHVKPLGQLFRAKFRSGLAKTPWMREVNARAWKQSWVVDCRPVGSGATALTYLAPYIFRIALSNNRIERVSNEAVTFRYTDGKTGEKKRTTLPVDAFISRFLAHVLPKGFVKVRSYGLLCPGKRQLLTEVRSMLMLQQAAVEPPVHAVAPPPERAAPDVRCCPSCGQAMQLVKTLPPQRHREQAPQPAPLATSRGPPLQRVCVLSWYQPTRCAEHTWLVACAVVVVSAWLMVVGGLV